MGSHGLREGGCSLGAARISRKGAYLRHGPDSDVSQPPLAGLVALKYALKATRFCLKTAESKLTRLVRQELVEQIDD